jgi:tetratricopeptide (TPR) repeat protein
MTQPIDDDSDIIWDDPVYQKVHDGLKAKKQSNLDLAEKLFLEAVKQGSKEALAEIGVLYVEQGQTTFANRALKVAIESCEIGSLQQLAGLRWKGSDKIAELIFQRGSEGYDAGEKNYRNWYKLAARLGNLRAATLLSFSENSVEEQKEWLSILIESEDSTAIVELADMFLDELNFEEAENLVERAKSLGSPDADRLSTRLERVKTSRSSEYQEVCSIFELAFDSKNRGDLALAEAQWRQVILYEGYDHFDRVLEALDCLGVLVANQGRLLEAADFWCEAYRRSISDTYKQEHSNRLRQLVGKATGPDLAEIRKKVLAVGLDF